MIHDREDFRDWLSSFEGHEKPFDRFCPLATWQRHFGIKRVLFVDILAHEENAWMQRFILRIDEAAGRRPNGSAGLIVTDWSDITAKQALQTLDDMDLAS